jgi:hypothetical protein
MRTIIVVFAIAMLCFGQDAFAQAPKEVIIVDGQVAVSNLPATQTVNGTVSIDNLPAVQETVLVGAATPIGVFAAGGNPIPVKDANAPFEEDFGTLTESFTGDNHSIFIQISPDKLLRLKYMSVSVGGHTNSVFRCQMFYGFPNINHHFDLYVTSYSGVDSAKATGSAQWSDLPLASFLSVFCQNQRSDLSGTTGTHTMEISWYGGLYLAPPP